ncbi:PrsW family intramembrane metalloprotease [Microbacterium sp.]|uniref:PrsW family intramembrane metalloprotease n=1 Tax=Microbacterium sp. TaxID=51671 RepID=UPI003A85013E
MTTYPSILAQDPHAEPAAIPAAPARAAALPAVPRRGRSAPMWIFALLAVGLIGLVSYLLTYLGGFASVIAMVLALIPLAGVLLAVRLVDRWEPEPTSLVIIAVAWGAIVSVGIALGVDAGLSLILGARESFAAEAFSSVVQAPVVEEAAKGLGVFLIFVFARRAFDGPVDGIVYGALVGAGFAFTENILYFASSLIEHGVEGATLIFFLRGILSPFAHVMFTAVTGYALGTAARAGVRPAAAVGTAAGGLFGAIALHALWNGSAMFSDFYSLYLTLQVPLFALFIIGVVLLLREESRVTRERLGDYVRAGWFTTAEVDMLATRSGRRGAIAWARTLRGDRSDRMRAFIVDATGLAAARQRAITGRDPHATEDERVFLARAAADRAALLAP